MTIVIAAAPALTGIAHKTKARLTRRRGAPILQPYCDPARLVREKTIVADSATSSFRVAPYLIFASTWVAAASAPTFATGLLFSWSADLIAIVALLAFARFALTLAGMDVGTSLGGSGSSREAMFAPLAEPAMITIVFCLALLAGSTQLSTIAAYFTTHNVGLRAMLGLVVSSTFARSPALALILVFGLLIAFGALLLRMQGMAFGPATGGDRPSTASAVPILAHLSSVLLAGLNPPPPLVAWFQHVASMLK